MRLGPVSGYMTKGRRKKTFQLLVSVLWDSYKFWRTHRLVWPDLAPLPDREWWPTPLLHYWWRNFGLSGGRIITRGIRIVILTDLSYRPVWPDLVPLPDRVWWPTLLHYWWLELWGRIITRSVTIPYGNHTSLGYMLSVDAFLMPGPAVRGLCILLFVAE